MKRTLAAILTLALVLSLFTVPAMAAETVPNSTIEENGFVFERLRNGALKLVSYTLDAKGKTVNIPDTVQNYHVERIGEYAFNGCKMSSVTIPDTVQMIESGAFNDCTEIQRVSIPNSVFFIDGNPFTGCKSLQNISLDPKHPTLQRTSDGALYSQKNKMLLCFPYALQTRTFSVMKGTLIIGKNAFYGCDQLESINLPNTVTEIGEGAFTGCTKLISITLPDSLLSIGAGAFMGCTSLRGISLPREISRIERSTFLRCASLADVSFSENLTTICDMAFKDCGNLHEIHLPAHVSSIGTSAFNGCATLTDAYIPVSVTEIGDSAFDNCSVRLYMHLEEYAFAEIYARIYDISFTYDNGDVFLNSTAE